MRRAAKIDENQPEIVKALRAIGCKVAITSSAGDGFPDLVVGYRQKNFLIEIKDGNKPPSKQKLTPDQLVFHAKWLGRGQIAVVNCVDAAIKLVTS